MCWERTGIEEHLSASIHGCSEPPGFIQSCSLDFSAGAISCCSSPEPWLFCYGKVWKQMKSAVFVPPFWLCDRSSLQQMWKWKTGIRKSLKKGWRKSESEVGSFIWASCGWEAESKEEGQICIHFEGMSLSREHSDQEEDPAHSATPGYVAWLSRKK